jgi:hypothetical protein
MNQHQLIARQQRVWAAQAFRDARYNHQQAILYRRSGQLIRARNSEQESRWDLWWGNRRLGIARKESRK